jgi:type I restriction enzyme S subunit
VVRLGDIISLEYGKGLTEKQRENGGFPVFGSNGIIGYHSQYLIKAPGIIVGRKGTIGAITWSEENFWPIDTTYYVKLKRSDIYLKWLFYKLSSIPLAKLNMATGTPGLNRNLVYTLQIPLPPLPEQRRIAEILSTVDCAIQKVDEAIARTERLKRGLMQRLLTEGIGHERFKFSKELGCDIPEEWEVVRLGDVCNQRNEVVQPSGEGKYRFIGLEHITSSETRIHNYDLDINVKSSKFRFYAGDVLYGKLRPYLDKAVLVDFDGICSTDLLVLTTSNEGILAEFLIYVIHSNKFLQHAISTTSGTNHPRTSWKAISKFKFGLPPFPEQQKIASILSTVDKKLELERRRKEKLDRIKKGLMNDLLTGRKRVKVGG